MESLYRIFNKKVIENRPFYVKQFDAMDCGPACLSMISKLYGRSISIKKHRAVSHISREGVSLLGISDAAESTGFRTIGIKSTLEKLTKEDVTPFIAHWHQNHFVVVYKIKKNKIYVADPASGKLTYTKEEFLNHWVSTKGNGENQGIALLLEPTPDFYNQSGEKDDKTNFTFLFKYLRPHKKLIIQLVLGLILGSLLQLIFPFLYPHYQPHIAR